MVCKAIFVETFQTLFIVILMIVRKYKAPKSEIILNFRWQKGQFGECDITLDYSLDGNDWRHFGLVCKDNNLYCWGDGLRNFGESLEDAKEKLQERCAESVIMDKIELIKL